jgi:hypothetical protein
MYSGSYGIYDAASNGASRSMSSWVDARCRSYHSVFLLMPNLS